MKPILLYIILATALTTSANAGWREDYSNLLQKYATAEGVDYANWASNSTDKALLKSVVDAIAEEIPSGSRNDKLAYYINAYNAWILFYFVDDHPRENNNAIKRGIFFSSNGPVIAGKKTSFSKLETDVIRAGFSEPRIHFALNCASRSCPPLLDRAYSGANLDAELTAQTEDFLNNNSLGLRLSGSGKTAYISEIFKFFAEDFDDVKTFINQFRDAPLGPEVKIRFQDYDWSRNDAS
ncbi:MAG: hypothetical protein ACI8UO_001375 [Verrucomicrobiales bacterium]|jgi:hypothetical protein